MDIVHGNGIEIRDGSRTLFLDPKRKSGCSIVTHGHTDHLRPGAYMTPETLAILKVRRGTDNAIPMERGRPETINGFGVELRPAGHVFGSAMVRVEDVLYTGDFNPEGGLTCSVAKAVACDRLVIEATYGMPDLSLPPKDSVALDLLTWLEHEANERPVAIGAYEFGKAQEVIALANTLGVPVLVTPGIARISDVYRAHGIDLEYTDVTQVQGIDYPYVLVTSPSSLSNGAGTPAEEVRSAGGAAAYVSGWCIRYNYKKRYRLDAQFPLSDHADFEDLLWFTEQCGPKRVYTVHGYTKRLAREIESRLGIPAEALE